MDFKLSDEQQMLVDGAERLMREQFGFEAHRKLMQSAEGFSREHWAQFAELGWLMLGIPEDVGGLGGSFEDTALLFTQFGKGLVLEPFLSTAVLCARIVDRSGAEAQRQELLPALAEGKLLLALAHSEQGARFDLAYVEKTTAQRQGDGYVIDGAKTVVLGGPSADRLIVSARMDQGFGLFVVDPNASGVTRRNYPMVDGTRASDVLLNNVQVPASALLVAPSQALAVLEEATDRAILALVAESVGIMEAVLDITADYLKTRVQFGQPLGKFQALQHRMAEMFIEMEEARSMMYRGLSCIDAEPAVRRRAISAAKVLVAQSARVVGQQGIQLHGGIGVTEEYVIGHYYKRILNIEKYFGDSEYHLGKFVEASAG